MHSYILPHMRALLLTLALTATAQAQFTIQDSHTTASLRGIHNVGNGVAWASGTNGTVLHTTDGGTTWQTCPIPPDAEKLDFRGVQAFDANTAIVMSSGKGDLSRLYKTTDACKTWKLIFTNPDKDGFWDALRFNFDSPKQRPAQRSGILVGDPVNGEFVVFVTHDGGDSWQSWADDIPGRTSKHHGPIKANKDESIFAASNSSAITARNDEVRFVTGGAGGSQFFVAEPTNVIDLATSFKFRSIKLPFPSSATSGAFSIAERPFNKFQEDLMVVGGDYNFPDATGFAALLPHRTEFDIAPSLSLGRVRQKIVVSKKPPHGYRSSVAYDFDTDSWITVGPNGTDISTDDGKNWRPLTPSPTDAPDADKNWNALSLPYAVGPKGRIGKLNPLK